MSKSIKGNKRKNNNKKRNNRERALYVTIIVCLIFMFLIGKLTYIMIYKSKEYKSMAQGQWNSQVIVKANRGDIVDRNGSILATSIDVYSVDLDLEAIDTHIQEKKTTKEEVAKKLAEASGLSIEEVKEKLNPSSEDGVEIKTSNERNR